jgi:F0F1-type ATP synthase assembly protein I
LRASTDIPAKDSRIAGIANGKGLPTVAALMETKAAHYNPTVDALRGFAGAVVGGGVDYFVFGWLTSQGYYAVALPGVLLGIGAGMLRQRQSLAFSIACGVAALALGILAEWKHFPYAADQSLGYFLEHLRGCSPVTLIMIALGSFAGYWFSRKRGRHSPSDSRTRPGP